MFASYSCLREWREGAYACLLSMRVSNFQMELGSDGEAPQKDETAAEPEQQCTTKGAVVFNHQSGENVRSRQDVPRLKSSTS